VSVPLRNLSPTKTTGRGEYLAVLEYTRVADWHEDAFRGDCTVKRNALPPRIEKRLAICMDRVKSAGVTCGSVLDAVALVGVVGEYDCQEAVQTLLAKPASASTYPLLKAMFTARRFVFFRVAAMIPVGCPVYATTAGGGDE
jgi:hypothetical protein